MLFRGVATVFAIKNAGLAIGIGVGSSFIVLISFIWGIFVFGEHVHSRLDACFAVGCMMTGLLGMAYYSAPSIATPDNNNLHNNNLHHPALMERHDSSADSDGSDYQQLDNDEPQDDDEDDDDDHNCGDADDEESPAEHDHYSDDDGIVVVDNSMIDDPQQQNHIICCGMKFQRRTLGILSAMFTGIYGGSIMGKFFFSVRFCFGADPRTYWYFGWFLIAFFFIKYYSSNEICPARCQRLGLFDQFCDWCSCCEPITLDFSLSIFISTLRFII